MNAPDSATLAAQLEGYTLEVDGVNCDADAINALREVCGSGTEHARTAVGLSVMYAALEKVVGDPGFPLPFDGIVHVEQEFAWGVDVEPRGSLQLQCSMHSVVVRPRMALFTLRTSALREDSHVEVVRCDARMMAQLGGGDA